MESMRLAVLLLTASLGFAQLTSNSVTVTSSKNATPQPDQVVFSITVDAGSTTALSDVLAAVQSAGVTAANFTGVGAGAPLILDPTPVGSPTASTLVEWTFTLPVPISSIKSTTAMLTALQQNLQKNTALSLSFSIQGTQVSTQLAQSQTCVVADLLADARSQAQALAAVAGRSVTGTLAISGSTTNGTGNCSITVTFGLVGN